MARVRASRASAQPGTGGAPAQADDTEVQQQDGGDEGVLRWVLDTRYYTAELQLVRVLHTEDAAANVEASVQAKLPRGACDAFLLLCDATEVPSPISISPLCRSSLAGGAGCSPLPAATASPPRGGPLGRDQRQAAEVAGHARGTGAGGAALRRPCGTEPGAAPSQRVRDRGVVQRKRSRAGPLGSPRRGQRRRRGLDGRYALHETHAHRECELTPVLWPQAC